MNPYVKPIINLINKIAHFTFGEVTSYDNMRKFIRHTENQPAPFFIGKSDNISQDTMSPVLEFPSFATGKRIIMTGGFEFDMIFPFPQLAQFRNSTHLEIFLTKLNNIGQKTKN